MRREDILENGAINMIVLAAKGGMVTAHRGLPSGSRSDCSAYIEMFHGALAAPLNRELRVSIGCDPRHAHDLDGCDH